MKHEIFWLIYKPDDFKGNVKPIDSRLYTDINDVSRAKDEWSRIYPRKSIHIMRAVGVRYEQDMVSGSVDEFELPDLNKSISK